jgi:hypothetical protein
MIEKIEFQKELDVKRQKIFSLLKTSAIGLTLLSPMSALAAHLLSITATTPFPAQVLASSKTSAAYTVTNVSKIPLTVVNQSEFSSGLSLLSSTCGLLKAGQSCSIQVQLAAPPVATLVSSALQLWAKPSRDGASYPIIVQVLQKAPSPSPVTSIAVGQDLTGTQPPLLTFSNTSNLTAWNVQRSFSGAFPLKGGFNTAASTGTGTSAIYLAAGTNNDTENALLTISQNGGTSWSVASSPFYPNGNFQSTAATGTGSTAILTAAGFMGTSTFVPILTMSLNGGTSWVDITIPGITTGEYSSISCTGTGVNAVCIVVGNDLSLIAPFVGVNRGGNTTWTNSSSSFTSSETTTAVNCVGSGLSASCVIVGSKPSSGFIALSVNAGQNWVDKSISPQTAADSYVTVSCTENGLCATAGVGIQITPFALVPLLASSINGGNSWSPVSSSLPANGGINSTSCAESTCAAVGTDAINNAPLLVVTTDGASSWSTKSISGIAPGAGSSFTSVTCQNGSTNVICTAAGLDPSVGAGKPILATSIDGGNTWAYQTVANLPAEGIFYGTAEASPSLKQFLINAKNKIKKVF